MDAGEYKHVVLGLIFLKYIYDTFEEHQRSWLPQRATMREQMQRIPTKTKPKTFSGSPAAAKSNIARMIVAAETVASIVSCAYRRIFDRANGNKAVSSLPSPAFNQPKICRFEGATFSLKFMSKASFFISLVLLSGLAAASGGLEPSRPVSTTEPLEKYDNPPAPLLLQNIGVSPGMISQHDTFISYQVNVNANGQNITGDAANEPSISVDPTNGNKMTIAWRQFNSVSSNFRQAGWGYTTNGGTSWTFPGVLENNVFRSDPVTNSDETGNFFYLSLQSDQAQSFFCDQVWRSLNGGQSWTVGGPAHGGDKEWFTIDKTNSTGHGFQYQFWTGFFACDTGAFSRSTDGGVTWMNPINIPNSAQTGTLDVDTNGNLFIGGTGGSQFSCIRSSNAKNGGVTPTFDQVTSVSLGGSLVQGGINGVGLCGQVFLTVDRSGTSYE